MAKLVLQEVPPSIELEAHNGQRYSTRQYRGLSPVLVFFYPRVETGVCSAEVCAFRDDFREFQRRNIALLGVSEDPIPTLKKYAARQGIPFPLLHDAEGKLSEAWGARGLIGTTRSYFLIDRSGALVWQHTMFLPVFKLSNAEILATIDRLIPGALIQRETRTSIFVPPPHI